jgi:hypothetical protein
MPSWAEKKRNKMRKLIVRDIMSLDGTYEGPDHNVMVLPGEGIHERAAATGIDRPHATKVPIIAA